MISETVPKVSLGMPVYNGERYIEEALDSLLAQTFSDFEIVISDNASTDRTEEICRLYAEKDDRIRYIRNRSNIGVINNFNSVFRLSRGEYFKWCASDDVCAPEYLERAVEVMDADPTIVLVFPLLVGIDEDGCRKKNIPGQITDLGTEGSVSSPDPVARFRKLIRHMWWVDAPFYGLMRAAALAETDLHRHHVSGDQLMVAEMVFKGRYCEIPEELFFSRYHSNKTSAQQKTRRQRAELIANKRLGRGVTAWWKILADHPSRIIAYVSFVRNADLSMRQRSVCYYEIARSLAWWLRLRLHGFLLRWRDFASLRPNYPPR